MIWFNPLSLSWLCLFLLSFPLRPVTWKIQATLMPSTACWSAESIPTCSPMTRWRVCSKPSTQWSSGSTLTSLWIPWSSLCPEFRATCTSWCACSPAIHWWAMLQSKPKEGDVVLLSLFFLSKGMNMFVCVYLCLNVCYSMFSSIYVCAWMSPFLTSFPPTSFSLSPSLCLSLCVCLSLCLSLCLCLSVYLCLSVSVFLSLCLSISLSFFLCYISTYIYNLDY